jgi:hypothetical protein
LIDSHLVDRLVNLKTLDLSGNNLSFIDSQFLRKLVNLEKFLLSNNLFSRIDRHLIQGLNKLKYVYLHNNKFDKNYLELFFAPNVEYISFKRSDDNEYGDNNIGSVVRKRHFKNGFKEKPF